MMVTKWSFKLTLSLPPSPHDHGLQVQRQTHLIVASKRISQLTQSQPQNASLSLLDLLLKVHLQTHLNVAFKYISKLAPSQCGETMELLQGESPSSTLSSTSRNIQREIVNHSGSGLRMWWTTWLWGTTQIEWMIESSARVCEKPQRLCESMNPQEQCIGPSARNDRWNIWCNAMIPMYPRVNQIYTPRRSVHLPYSGFPICWPLSLSPSP